MGGEKVRLSKKESSILTDDTFYLMPSCRNLVRIAPSPCFLKGLGQLNGLVRSIEQTAQASGRESRILVYDHAPSENIRLTIQEPLALGLLDSGNSLKDLDCRVRRNPFDLLSC